MMQFINLIGFSITKKKRKKKKEEEANHKTKQIRGELPSN